ncbi:MAG: hypothetical protein WCP28_10230 [Actinomycetes bacterium]
MHDYLIDLSPSGVLALSLIPVMIFAVGGATLSTKVGVGNDNLLTSVLRIVGGALVFVSAFTVANLWQQADKYLYEVTAEYAAGWDLDGAVQAAAPPAAADAVTAVLRSYRDEVARTEIGRHVPPEGSTESRAAFAAVQAQTTKAVAQASTPELGANIKDAMKTLTDARSKRVDYPELAGLPGVIVVTIMLLAWIAALLLGVYPGGGQRWVKVVQTSAAVVALCMIQVAVFYLATRAGMTEVVQYSLQL